MDQHEIFSLNVILMVSTGLATVGVPLCALSADLIFDLQVGLLGMSVFLAYLMKKYHFYYVPESAAAMLVWRSTVVVCGCLHTGKGIHPLAFSCLR